MQKHKGHENVGKPDQGDRFKEKYGPDYFRNIARMRSPANVALTARLGGEAFGRKAAADPHFRIPNSGKYPRRSATATGASDKVVTCTCGVQHTVPPIATCVTCTCGRDIWYMP